MQNNQTKQFESLKNTKGEKEKGVCNGGQARR